MLYVGIFDDALFVAAGSVSVAVKLFNLSLSNC